MNHIKNKKYIIFMEKNLKTNMCKIKNIVKVETIVIIHRNIEVLRIAYII